MQIRSAAATDIGKVRRANEDRFVCDDALHLYGVADGIGGLPGGAEAAQIAVTTLRKEITAMPDGAIPDLVPATRRINQAVCSLAAKISPIGMGTTLTYAVLRENQFCLAHVGDSRCYRIRDGKLTPLTMDHTVENDARRRAAAGYAGYNEAQRKSLTRCIGQQGYPEVDTLQLPLQANDRYFFCSDGIDKAINELELAVMLTKDDAPADILARLIDTANERGGRDNATCVLVQVDAL
ncbi:serine/threonine protein phosphatase PrpC [Ereboglobus sp. PH5-5]|uniref:PP2C family protein-serine/threonine phosphatase n=1 Tax=Ereboglobus sp. PH5-5 TaxID=2940529 RepID=UPI002405B3EC|nr:PP2C family serine/threonine-protein phosphatase [Ereboglobus sp. PH5-5]MDF9832803.1 serine/threonine protein phosphatase PrpC [Ereboglobus sp. PH5-5]